MPFIIDVRGDDRDKNHGPLLGRLRGVEARGEIRRTLLQHDKIYFKAPDAHFVLRKGAPSTSSSLPEILSNAERQLVVHKRIASELPDVENIPVRIVDTDGKTVSNDYVLAATTKIEDLPGPSDDDEGGSHREFSDDGYFYAKLAKLKEPRLSSPLARLKYTLLIACDDSLAKKLESKGVPLVKFADYVEDYWPPPPSTYELFVAGTEGASFDIADFDDEQTESGQALLSTWPRSVKAKMKPPKSRKKIVDFMSGPGAPIISMKAKAVLEKLPHGLDGVELLPLTLLDHANKQVKGEFWLMHVVGTQPYVNVAESDIEVVSDKLWTAREIVVDDAALTGKPAFFRVPGARYPWVFVRRDVIEALNDAGLAGFRTEHPFAYAYPVEGGGLSSVC